MRLLAGEVSQTRTSGWIAQGATDVTVFVQVVLPWCHARDELVKADRKSVV